MATGLEPFLAALLPILVAISNHLKQEDEKKKDDPENDSSITGDLEKLSEKLKIYLGDDFITPDDANSLRREVTQNIKRIEETVLRNQKDIDRIMNKVERLERE